MWMWTLEGRENRRCLSDVGRPMSEDAPGSRDMNVGVPYLKMYCIPMFAL